ncbi:MAG: GerAB/ArcD/ProY family transporter [Oscillospiraceae bacterium]
MDKTVKIHAPQIFFLMFLSRIIVTLTYIPLINVNLEVTDNIADITFATIMIFITAIPIFLLLKSESKTSFLDRCYCINHTFGRITALIYAICFLYSGIIAIQRFNIFATSVIFPETNFNSFLLVIIVACTFAALMGLEAMGRSGILIFSLIALSLVFILVSVSSNFDWLNFSPIFYNGIKPVISSSLLTVSRTIETTMLLILMPKIKGNLRKGLVWWILGIGATMFIITLYIGGVMGEYSNTQLFPVYALTVIAKLGFLQRIDVLLTSSWILCVFVKVSIELYLIKECLCVAISKKYNKLYIVLAGIIISVSALIIKPNITNITMILNKSIAIEMFVLIVILLPSILLIAEKVKDRKNYEK